MGSREPSRRAFLRRAGAVGGSAVGATGAAGATATGSGESAATGSAVGVPGLDTDHRVRWTFETDERATIYPAVRSRGAVVALVRTDADDGLGFELYAFETDSGETRWRRGLDDRSTFPTAAGGTIYAVEGNRLLALDAADGSERWRFATAGLDYRSFAVGDEAAFVADSSGVTAVDVADGSERWSTAVDADGPLGQPTVGEERVYLGGERGFRALDRATGRERWTTRTAAGERTLAAGVWEDQLVGWSSDAVYGLRVADGTERWRTDHEGVRPYPAAGALAGDAAYLWGGSLAAIDLRTGAKRWTFESEYGEGHSPVVRDGGVYFPLSDDFVALDAADGSERWRTGAGTPHRFWGTATDGLVYVVGEREVAAVDAASGRERWTLDFGDERGLWADASGDLALAATRSGTLYAVDRPSPLATAPVATAERFATSPAGLGLLGLLGAGLLGVGYRRATVRGDDPDADVAFGRLDRLAAGPVTETYRKRIRTPDGPALVAETRLREGADAETRRIVAEAVERWAELSDAVDAVLPILDRGTGPDGEYDAGDRRDADDPVPWFETPFAAGGSLADAWPVAARERVEVASAVARTLHAAHREGVAHGRLAPRHVFRGTSDLAGGAAGAGTDVLVGGWFLADALAGVGEERDPYAPPEGPRGTDVERADGDASASTDDESAGVAGDVYRVGALAYHLLAGAVPDPDPEPASALNPGLSADLDGVLARALANDPVDRHESALAFDDAFRWAAFDR
ncbi:MULTISPECIES: PQQ-binding-like beta-propeller repeat protein [Halorussus]|uniref:outer membrane protein assembly factor BamB family protein n=1 Tax=Halorussus TaxID=1070314 RepID=UPI000E2162F6|nr:MULTISPECIES: PQQ-binding-like beta-propeller repeat protein [Halorussus]NHN60376.1 PQQ-binding-like beta-propeller repeat protein [Halorussus sp. JP-T4]